MGEDMMEQKLQELLDLELKHFQTYLLYSCQLDNWGIKKLSEIMKKEADGEKNHLQSIIDRMLFLEYHPHSFSTNIVAEETNIITQLESLTILEKQYLDKLKSNIAYCHEVNDYGTEELLEEILIDLETQIDWLQQQKYLCEAMGQDNYIQTMI